MLALTHAPSPNLEQCQRTYVAPAPIAYGLAVRQHEAYCQMLRARELKAGNLDWTDVLAAEAENPRARLAAEILASDSYASTGERAEAFVKHGGGCRATFFNYRRYLLK
jgi:hypothetical protein